MRALHDGSDWVAEFVRAQPIEVRTQVASEAVAWLTRTLAVLGETPRRWKFDLGCQWRYPGRGLALTTKVDFVRTDGQTPILVARALDDAGLDRLAYQLLVWTLAGY